MMAGTGGLPPADPTTVLLGVALALDSLGTVVVPDSCGVFLRTAAELRLQGQWEVASCWSIGKRTTFSCDARLSMMHLWYSRSRVRDGSVAVFLRSETSASLRLCSILCLPSDPISQPHA